MPELVPLSSSNHAPQDHCLLSAYDGVKLAKNTLLSLPCRWDLCSCILTSWSHLQKHVNLHVHLYDEGLYTCAWEGCRSPSSVYIEKAALWTHILQSHLQIILLPCPILDCAESFSQHLEITSHILTSHAPCLGSPKTALKRSAMPHHYPASSYDDLPYISNIVVNSFQISSPYVSTSSQISNPLLFSSHQTQSSPSSTQLQSTQGSGQLGSSWKHFTSTTRSEETSLSFKTVSDLSKPEMQHDPLYVDFTIQPTPPSDSEVLIQSHGMIEVPVEKENVQEWLEDAHSIHYPVFKKQVGCEGP